ncbi:RICIN domain-containing protein [Marinimicrobium agarilyticum]|uniref:RICIN domain-containing protein n=1 Tax=Marinimicrobium agarilyticum TaxID=306546 RepID=UPI00040D7FA1|nr:RICIN domain-containing protein [Marinimicrobium agarilyticum]
MRLNYLYQFFTSLLLLMLISVSANALNLSGGTEIHDPATIMRDGNTYWTFGTGDGNQGIVSRYSTDLINWQHGGAAVFAPGTWPNWINGQVANFDGNFWAPDVIEMNGRYYLYYSAFGGNGGMESAIGVAVTDSLNNPNWQDLGMVVSTRTEPQSSQGEPVNAIDAGVFRDANGGVWMAYGSHYAGIYVTQIDPNTGLRLNNNRYPVVGNGGGWNEYEAAQVQYINGYYYMFVNLGACCAGNQSDYYIVTGRSTSPTGPYIDRNGVDLWHGGGTTVLASAGRYIGPGHFGYYNYNGHDLASIHYYDGNTADGWPSRLDILELNFQNGWPTFNRNFALGDGNDGGSGGDGVEGRVTLTSVHSGKLLEVASGSHDDGANVVQWEPNGSANQQWDITDLGNGYYSIRAAHSGKSLDVFEWSQEDGGDIRQWAYSGGNNQQWELVPQGNNQYAIISRFSGKALDVYDFSTENGGNIVQWSFNGGNQQLWTLNHVN